MFNKPSDRFPTVLLSHWIWDRRESGESDDAIQQTLIGHGLREQAIADSFSLLREMETNCIHSKSIQDRIVERVIECVRQGNERKLRINMLDAFEDERTLYRVYVSLAETLSTSTGSEAIAAAHAISFVDAFGQLPLIQALDHHQDDQVRVAVLKYLINMDHHTASVIAAIRKASEDDDPRIALAASETLAKIDNQSP